VNTILGIILLAIVVFVVGKTLWTAFRMTRISRRNEAQWARIREMANSDNPMVREQAQREYIDKLDRGPYG
jgi:hypothetical protein